MLLANDYMGNKIKVKPNTYGTCPVCDRLLMSRCGDVKIWHWAHKGTNNCIYKPETLWHLNWKELAYDLEHLIEFKINEHIADIITNEYRVIELQHSPISKENLLNRCYNAQKEGLKIDWIFDLSEQYKGGRLKMKEKNYITTEEIIETTYEFRVGKSRQSLSYLFNNNLETKFGNVWFDLGIHDRLFFVREMDKKSGYGHIINTKTFFKKGFFKDLQNIIESEKNKYIYSEETISFNKANNYSAEITFTSDKYKSMIYNNQYYGRCKVIENGYIKTLLVNNKTLGKQLDELELNNDTFKIIYKDSDYDPKCKVIKI